MVICVFGSPRRVVAATRARSTPHLLFTTTLGYASSSPPRLWHTKQRTAGTGVHPPQCDAPDHAEVGGTAGTQTSSATAPTGVTLGVASGVVSGDSVGVLCGDAVSDDEVDEPGGAVDEEGGSKRSIS